MPFLIQVKIDRDFTIPFVMRSRPNRRNPLNHDKLALGDEMRAAIFGLVVSSSLTAGGCATLPEIHKKDYVQIKDVLLAVDCELYDATRAIARDYPGATNQVVLAAYTLQVADTLTGDGSTSVVIPISNGTFTLGFSANAKRKATRKTEVKVLYETNDLECNVDAFAREAAEKIEGSLGLKDWLLEIADVLKKSRKQPKALSYEVSFVVTKGGKLEPRFGIVRQSGHQIGGVFGLSGSRETTHKIVLSVAEFEAGPVPADVVRRLERNLDSFLLSGLRTD